jgi:hypothetical protein
MKSLGDLKTTQQPWHQIRAVPTGLAKPCWLHSARSSGRIPISVPKNVFAHLLNSWSYVHLFLTIWIPKKKPERWSYNKWHNPTWPFAVVATEISGTQRHSIFRFQVNVACWELAEIPSGKHTKNYGKSSFSMGKSTISMAIFNSFLYVYQKYPINVPLKSH